MKNHTHLVISAFSVAIFALLAPASFAQKGEAMSKAQAMAQQLSLTPATKGENPAHSCRRSTKSARHQERQFAFKNAENTTTPRYSSADRSADEGDSFT